MFNFIKTKISDLILIEPQIFGDKRGFFLESYNKKDFLENGISVEFCQDNHSKSKKGVLRGLHFQTKNTQSKLVRVVRGAVFDVAVDLRKNSKTYGEYFGEILSEENKKQLFIPQGFAHGFLVLEDNTEFLYKCDDYYSPKFDGGILFNDKKIGINWDKIMQKYGIKDLSLSEKDKKQMSFKEFDKINNFTI